MKALSLGILLAIGLLVIARDAAAQAAALVTEQETLNNGVLVIELQCSAVGNFDFEGDGTEDYAGVSVGGESEYGCALIAPNGAEQHLTSDYDYGESETIDSPVTVSGTWQYYASSFLWFWSCDPDVDNCVADDGDTYSYMDPYGFTVYAGDPTQCPLGDVCYGLYTGDDYLTDDYNMAYAYTGNSWGNPGSIYVDALDIDISPSSDILDAGGQVTFTGEASNTGNFLPFFQWTLVSGPGSGTFSGSEDQDYTYTAPGQVSSGNTTATIQGCITNLTSTPVCQTVTVDMIPETISIESPSPQTILADGVSVSYLYADIGNGPQDASVNWTPTCPPSPGTACSTGNTTATYTAPTAAAAFPAGAASPQTGVTITGCISGASPSICSTNTLTLVEPVSITSITPTALTAGTTALVTINGAGFGPAGSTPNVTFSSTSWGPITLNSQCTAQSNTSVACPSVTIPANLSNTNSQAVTITVSTTTAGIDTQATYSVNVIPIAYTYGVSLLPNTSSLTYGSSSTITPVITCKVQSTGAACAGNVQNPQQASASITNGIGLGSLSCTSNCSSTALTDIALIAAPSRNLTVQMCASIASTVCATANFSIPATAITLNPPTMSAPLTGGKTQAFTASIQNEGTATGLTWTLTPSPSGAVPGTLTSSTTTITQQGSPASGTSGPNTYTAPNPITAATAATLKVCMTVNTNICATPVAITLDPAPTFSVTATNPSQTTPLSLGHSMSYAINVSPLYGFSGPVALSIAGLPQGVTARFIPAALTTSGTSTLTLTSSYNNPTTLIGAFPITVTGTSGSASNSALIPLTTGPLQYAGYCGIQ